MKQASSNIFHLIIFNNKGKKELNKREGHETCRCIKGNKVVISIKDILKSTGVWSKQIIPWFPRVSL